MYGLSTIHRINQPAPAPAQEPDFILGDHGSIYVLYPQSDAARLWLLLHITESATWWCGGVVVAPQYVEAMLIGINQDRLEWEHRHDD
jgi:hypothetical protein